MEQRSNLSRIEACVARIEICYASSDIQFAQKRRQGKLNDSRMGLASCVTLRVTVFSILKIQHSGWEIIRQIQYALTVRSDCKSSISTVPCQSLSTHHLSPSLQPLDLSALSMSPAVVSHAAGTCHAPFGSSVTLCCTFVQSPSSALQAFALSFLSSSRHPHLIHRPILCSNYAAIVMWKLCSQPLKPR